MSSRLIRLCLAAALVGALSPAALAADAAKAPAEAPDKTTGCTKPLDECTRERIAALKSQSRKLTAAARLRPPKPLEGDERRQIESYDRWLQIQSNKARELAERGSAATTKEIQLSFNQQYLQLQRQMQAENARYRDVAEIMKNKHDAARNALPNVK
jgi:hypothetical protein